MKTKKTKTNYFSSLEGRVHLGIIFIFLLTFTSALYFENNNEYMRMRNVKVTITGHYSFNSSYEGGPGNKYLIVYNKQWGKFWVLVGSKSYKNLKNGDKTTFRLREFDIRQSRQKNIYFFVGVLLWGCSAAMFVLSILWRGIMWLSNQKLGAYPPPICLIIRPIHFY